MSTHPRERTETLNEALQDVAVCASSFTPDLWFSERSADIKRAKKLCGHCPLLEACREQGKTEEYGVWGGVLSRVDKAAQRARRLQDRRDRVLELHRDGLSSIEIGKVLDMASSSARHIISQAA